VAGLGRIWHRKVAMGEMLRVRRDFLRKTGMHNLCTGCTHPVHTSEATLPGDCGQKAIDPPGSNHDAGGGCGHLATPLLGASHPGSGRYDDRVKLMRKFAKIVSLCAPFACLHFAATRVNRWSLEKLSSL